MSIYMKLPLKIDVVGTGISATSYDEVLEVLRAPSPDSARVIAVCNVHSVMSARRHPALRHALEKADITTPDGMPLVWSLRASGCRHQARVYGPELMRRALESGSGTRHFLYGGSVSTLARLEREILRQFPGAKLAGSLSPPYAPIVELELERHLEVIRASEADVVWVSLGMPKQELWMETVRHQLDGLTLVGVGAAFDFLAGTVRQAPEWIQNSGFEWLFRLVQEPRRLWRRYIWNNPGFTALALGNVVRQKLQNLRYRAFPENWK